MNSKLLVVGLVLVLVGAYATGCSNGGSGSGSGGGSGAAAPTPTPPNAGPQNTAGPARDPHEMVVAHNAARGDVSPAANPRLPTMSWDADVANVAQRWANRCEFEHSSDSAYGENLYVSSNPASAQDAVDSWVSEVADYNYRSNSCAGECGHYTQVVWRSSTALGCGFADCPSIPEFGPGRLWVCNYSPPGNFRGKKPY